MNRAYFTIPHFNTHSNVGVYLVTNIVRCLKTTEVVEMFEMIEKLAIRSKLLMHIIEKKLFVSAEAVYRLNRCTNM